MGLMAGIGIGKILAKRQPMLRDVGVDFLAPHVEKWSGNMQRHAGEVARRQRSYAGEPTRRGAAEEIEEECLDLVVGMLRENEARAFVGGACREGREGAGAALWRSGAGCERIDFGPSRVRNADPPAAAENRKNTTNTKLRGKRFPPEPKFLCRNFFPIGRTHL